MRSVSADEIDGALTWPALIEALADAFRGGLAAPARHHHAIARPDGDATLLLMPAWSQEGHAVPMLGVKLASVFPGNGARHLPSVQAIYCLMDGATGVPLAVLDGARLTVWRTAAASALAARHLARPDARTMLMVGAGALAPFLIRAHRSVRRLDRILVWARRTEAARELVATLAREDISAEAAGDLEAAVRAADLVSCATLSTEPLVCGEWLKPGAHLDLVGAYSLATREADDAALARASVWIDTPAALREGGDVAVAIRDGTFAETAVRGDLAALVSGAASRRAAADEVTLFKSIGASVEDLAAARLVWRTLAR